ncbi:hypothetical protein JTE90_022432 [Oedothorax gibbosus]|uniref:Uncharacterized protein n=1 Tax=Oedothorax gibbosus TaxID=931172 RepID=A0AAV6TSE4_9ARAC|nr:hypothetical protein JTE90_022432 [Oedothorax gibbosus]
MNEVLKTLRPPPLQSCGSDLRGPQDIPKAFSAQPPPKKPDHSQMPNERPSRGIFTHRRVPKSTHKKEKIKTEIKKQASTSKDTVLTPPCLQRSHPKPQPSKQPLSTPPKDLQAWSPGGPGRKPGRPRGRPPLFAPPTKVVPKSADSRFWNPGFDLSPTCQRPGPTTISWKSFKQSSPPS